MRRRLLLLPLLWLGTALLWFGTAMVCFGADPAQEVWDVLSEAAAALSERNPEGFLAAFDPSMPGYDKLRDHVTALLHNADVQSAIELENDDGSAEERVEELDWLLTVRPEGDATASTRRQQRVKCRLRKTGKKWRIVAFEPVEFLAPPRK